MGAWDESRDHYERAYGEEQPHKAEWTHELAAGGAAFAGFEMFEKHQRAEGKQVSHSFAKSVLAGIVGAEVDKLAETKGEDAWDRHKAKEHAKDRAERMYDEHYIDGQGADSYDPNRYDAPNFERRGGGGYGREEYGRREHERREYDRQEYGGRGDGGYDQGYGRRDYN